MKSIRLRSAELIKLTKNIEAAGATIIEVDFPGADDVISPEGWDWCYAEGKSDSVMSQFEVVRPEFHRRLREDLDSLKRAPETFRSLEDIVEYDVVHTKTEGGVPWTHPAGPSGQDNFDNCFESKHGDHVKYAKAL